MRKELLIIASIIAIVAFATAATAEGTGMTVSHVANITGTGAASGDQVTAVGGNITNIDINGPVQTSNWAGFFGDVTGTLRLAGGANIFYNWGLINPTGYVLFSNESSVDWGNLFPGDPILKAQEDTALGLTGLTDSVANTFSSTATTNGVTIGTTTLSGNSNATNSLSTGVDWTTFLLEDTVNNGILYGVAINQSGLDYAGNAADFQILVPSGASRTYYVFADLE